MPHRLLALFFAGSLVYAQSTPAPANSPTDQKKVRLEGRVLSASGDPIRKANVRLMGSSGQPGQPPSFYAEASDNGGKFLFDDVAPGRYTLTADKAGFVPGRYGARSAASPGTQLSLTAGQEMKDLVFLLTPQGVISGRVTDDDGDPVRGVQISVLRSGYQRGRRQLQMAGAASTDDQGNFRAVNLAPGRYYLSATDRSNGFMMGVNERPGHTGAAPPESNVTTYYPQALDFTGASAIDVAAGAELAGFNIRLRKGRTYSIRGKAVDTTTGRPPENAMLSATLKQDGGVNPVVQMMGRAMQQARAPDGSFEFRNLTAGTYVLQSLPGGSMNGSPLPVLSGHLEVTIANASVEGVVLPLGPGREITGTVRLEGGDLSSLMPSQPTSSTAVANAAGVPVAVSMVGRRPMITLLDAEDGLTGVGNAQIKDDGTFQLRGATPGKYYVNTNAIPEGTYVKSIRFGNQDVTHAPLDLTSGSGGTLEILLSSKAGDVSGAVQNDKGEPMAGVQVTLWPKTPDAGNMSSGIRSANTDQNGSLKFTRLAPGDYFVAAWDDLEPGITQSFDFAAKFAGDAAAVKLGESGHEAVALKLISREKMAAEAAELP